MVCLAFVVQLGTVFEGTKRSFIKFISINIATLMRPFAGSTDPSRYTAPKFGCI